MELYAFVIMPSHIHLIVRQNKSRLSEVVRDFKSITAKEIIKEIIANNTESRKEWILNFFKACADELKQNKEYMFWQKTNHPVELHSAKVMNQKINYIHNNPVEAGIVYSPEYYVYSSAYVKSKIELSPI